MSTTFNLISVTNTFKNQWRFIVVFTLTAAAAAFIALFFIIPQYKAQTTLLPGNTVLADKARLFNPNIKDLYSYFGNGDDLDRLIAVVEMDTTFKQVVIEFNLTYYYDINETDSSLKYQAAIKQLRKNIQFIKTPNNQLIIRCFDKDATKAAAIANHFATIMEITMQNVWRKNYNALIQQLDSSTAHLKEQYYTLSNEVVTNKATAELNSIQINQLLDQISEYQRYRNEFTLALQSPPSSVLVLEKAVAAIKPTWPNKPLVIAAASLLALVFSSLLVLINHRSKEL